MKVMRVKMPFGAKMAENTLSLFYKQRLINNGNRD